MLSEWRQLSTLTRIFYIVGLSSFIGLAVMILTSMTGIGAIWELFKRRHCACDPSMETGEPPLNVRRKCR